MMNLSAELVAADQLAGFQAAEDKAFLPADSTLDVIRSGRTWSRKLDRHPLRPGSVEIRNCLFFGGYEGNGIHNMTEAEDRRVYDGGQFMVSLDGYFTPEMMFAGTCLPRYVRPAEHGPQNSRFAIDVADDYEIVEEPHIYLGTYHAHFGHCLVESLTKLWYVVQMDPAERARAKYVFFGGWGDEGGALRQVLQWLGIPISNVSIPRKNCLFRSLTVPSYAWKPWNNWDVYLSGVYFDFVDRVTTAAVDRSDVKSGARLYLSRSALAKSGAHHNGRTLEPDVDRRVEALAVEAGFDIVYPETMDLADQIAAVSRAACIAGPSGSAHHLSLFGRPGVRQIILTHEGFWMGGNDAVFMWNKGQNLQYVFGSKASGTDQPDLTANWSLDVADWKRSLQNLS